MKVLFLDIDGVLNTEGSRIQAHRRKPGSWGTHEAWVTESVDQLKRIIAETGCQLVISSDWRLPQNIGDLKNGFTFFQLPDWIGVTPVMGQNNSTNWIRGREINAWLSDKEVESFVIIDDNDWMLPEQSRQFVQTDPYFGLTENDANLAITVLKHVPVRDN